jgi:hypothetical protein
MIPRYAYYKPFKVQLPNKHEWQNGFNSDNERGLVWYTDAPKTSKDTGAGGVCKWGSIKGHSFSLGQHTMAFQPEIYAIKAYIMKNIEKGYRGRNINILSDSQAAVKVLNSCQVNSNLVWDCCQSLLKLGEHNRIHLTWVPGYMGIDENEMAGQFARQGSVLSFMGPEPALGISGKVAREVIRGCMNTKHEEYLQSIYGHKPAKAVLKGPSAKKAGELLNLSINQL